jgi:hypothetical protein
MKHSCRLWVSTRGEAGWESQIGAPTSKVPGTDVQTKSLRTYVFLHMVFPPAADLKSAPPYCAAPLAATVYPPRWWCRTPTPRMCMLDLMSASRRRASALPWPCFPAVRNPLQHPRPILGPSAPSSPIFFSQASSHLLIGTLYASTQLRKYMLNGPSERSWRW